MKFFAALALLAVFVSANGSVLPLGWAGPWNGALGQQIAIDTPYSSTKIIHPNLDAWGGWNVGPAAAIIAAQHVPLVVPHVTGAYVAANRGTVHVAPLDGHIQSVSSLNLQAAPGTW